jgi:hypothetical protein
MLFETALAVAWILKKDSDHRAKLILVHGKQRKLVQLHELKKTPGLKRSATKAAFSAAHAALITVSKGLSQAEIDSVKKHWSGLSGGLEAASKQLRRGWPIVYTLVYRDTSSYAHVADALSHMFIDKENNMVLRLVPGDWDLDRTPKVARLLLWGILDGINRRLKLGFDAGIEKVAPPTAHLKSRRPRRSKPTT